MVRGGDEDEEIKIKKMRGKKWPMLFSRTPSTVTVARFCEVAMAKKKEFDARLLVRGQRLEQSPAHSGTRNLQGGPSTRSCVGSSRRRARAERLKIDSRISAPPGGGGDTRPVLAARIL